MFAVMLMIFISINFIKRFDIFELGHLERMLGAGEDEAGILNSMTSSKSYVVFL